MLMQNGRGLIASVPGPVLITMAQCSVARLWLVPFRYFSLFAVLHLKLGLASYGRMPLRTGRMTSKPLAVEIPFRPDVVTQRRLELPLEVPFPLSTNPVLRDRCIGGAAVVYLQVEERQQDFFLSLSLTLVGLLGRQGGRTRSRTPQAS